MRARRTKVCRWCLQPLPDWSEVWPNDPGVYLFWGYPINKDVDKDPRLMTVTVEGFSDTFGTIYRTARSTIKKQTGAAGFFMPLMVPKEMPAESDLISLGDEAIKAKKGQRIKRLNKRSSRRLV
jgi:hypothetical protein